MLLNRICIAGVFLCGCAAVAQQHTVRDSVKNTQLNEVMITATRNTRQLANLPLPGAVVDSATIARAGVTRLNEILSEQTGLITVADFGGGEGLQMQGLDAAYTMIMIDGVPLTGRTAGTLDLSRITVGNIERIEIVKGASSALYGSEALAGVINIITKKPQSNTLKGVAAYRYASFKTHDANVTLSGGYKKLIASLFANHYINGGYDLSSSTPNNTVEPYVNTTLQPKLAYTVNDKLNISSSFRYYNQSQDYKLYYNDADYGGKTQTNEWNAQLKADHKWSSKSRAEYEIYTTNYRNGQFLNSLEGTPYENSFYNQWLIRPEIRTMYNLKNGIFTTGIGFNHESLNRTYFLEEAVFNSGYAYAQYDYNPGGRLNLLTGLRYDAHNKYRSQLSPKIAANYKVSEALSVKASVGYGYKAPDFRQLYFNFTNSSQGYSVLGYNVVQDELNALQAAGQITRLYDVNLGSPLKPESSINFNLGAYYKKKRLRTDINFFYNNINNLIDSRAVALTTNSQTIFSYVNINRVFTYGTELNAQYNITNALRIQGGYQYLIAKDPDVISKIKHGEVFARDRNTLESFQLKRSDYFGLFNRSRHMANIKLYYTVPVWKTDVALRAVYRSKYGLTDSNDSQGVLDKYDTFVKGYVLLHASATQPVGKHFLLQGGANNLLNYTDPVNISNLPGRIAYLKLQYNF